MTKTALIYHPNCELHDMGEDHPESPLRTRVIMERLKEDNLIDKLILMEAEQASKAHVLSVHHINYVEQLDRINPKYGLIQADPDTMMGPYTYEASYLAAGSGIQAVDGILNGDFKRAFCNIRPPGHHAEPGTTMGFCFFNNIAVAVEHALLHHKLTRVAIIDFDVHQCNGTIEAFENRPEVEIFTCFQHPFYPNSHWASEHPHIHLTPLIAFSDIRDVKKAWEEQWYPALKDHKPEMIFISAGFDAHTLDPMSQINWQSQDYLWLTNEIVKLANEVCEGKIVSILEGGYNLKALAESASLHIQGLLAD